MAARAPRRVDSARRYPFEDPQDPKNFQKTLQRIINVQYTIPPSISLSPPCIDLMKKMLVADPEARRGTAC